MAVLSDYAARLTERRFDAIELRGPGTELTIGGLARGPRRTAARMPAPTSTPMNWCPDDRSRTNQEQPGGVYAELRHQI